MSSTNFSAVHEAPPYSISPLLAQLSCIEHGFFGARGGVSSGIYSSLNCGFSSRDDHELVRENRRRVAACFNLNEADLHSLKQAHTTRVVQLGPGSEAQYDVTADGMVCKVSGVGLGPLGADCAPVLFVDPINRVIGAAHSGWKGALNGINEAVVLAMQNLGARIKHIHAAIGPSMQQQHYEVQADFQAHFERISLIDTRAFFYARQGKLYFDTSAYIHARLFALGIAQIERISEDTYSAPEHYFSYRRSCFKNEPDYGRQIAVIVLR
jgi:YfiH family protein